jgi:formate dehydrogenase iron-sulfur subunit
MSQAATELVRISGHAGVVPGKGLNREFQVCKLVDTTTCIGCKACEVACLEWNGYTFTETTFDNTYQTMPETAWNYWNLIKFNEHERADGTMMLLMRKDQCMHCADPGGGRRHCSVCQWHRRFPGGELYRLWILHDRLPLQHSEIRSPVA